MNGPDFDYATDEHWRRATVILDEGVLRIYPKGAQQPAILEEATPEKARSVLNQRLEALPADIRNLVFVRETQPEQSWSAPVRRWV